MLDDKIVSIHSHLTQPYNSDMFGAQYNIWVQT